ncbi:MAG: TldD/PmbA family protein, partial [Clostridia bacterium]|nr:TldD/PmbA family protein [Clostridia bacterium]
ASVSAETYRDEISAFSSAVGGMLLYRCIVNGKLGYASTERMDEAEMDALVARAAVNAVCVEKDEEAIIFGGAKPEDYREVPASAFVMPAAAVIKEEAMKCRNLIYAADSRIADGTECGAFAVQSTVQLFNSAGLDLGISVGNCGEYLQAVLDNGEEKQYDYDFLYNSFGDNEADLKNIAEEVVRGADAKFGAGTVATGKYNIIFDHKQMKAILSTFLSAFFAENAQTGLSLLKGKTGEVIAAECITITDDPFRAENPMQIPFDGEGVPTKTKNVVENGVLKTLLYNLTSAKKDGVETTGNASRSAASIGTRAFSFYINPGEMTKDELFAKAGNGIYVTEMKGFHAGANAVTGDFSIESAGFLIEDGKIGAPVKSFTVAGNFFALLKQIAAIDNVLEMKAPGFSQIGSPDVLVPEMSVAGD